MRLILPLLRMTSRPDVERAHAAPATMVADEAPTDPIEMDAERLATGDVGLNIIMIVVRVALHPAIREGDLASDLKQCSADHPNPPEDLDKPDTHRRYPGVRSPLGLALSV